MVRHLITFPTQAVRLIGAGLLLAVAAAQAASAAPAAPGLPQHQGTVARAIFTTGVKDREPIDRVLVLSNRVDEVYFFTDVRHMEGRKIVHRWEYEGRTIQEVPFEIGGPRWRVFSRKTLARANVGKWRVIVTDAAGWPLKAGVFQYAAPSKDGTDASVILPVDAEPTP